jgi:branched-chain amino acid transport system substrate-binding protein
MRHLLRRVSALVSAASLCIAGAALAEEPLRIGVITFLSGPAAGPFGVPAKNASDLLAEALNKGGQIPGYEKKGFGGRAIELIYVDEAGGPSKVVTEYRNLVERQNVDYVIGYISSGDCLAIAPVAEEMKKVTVLFDCGTPRVFEERPYRYVFRTRPHATMDAVAAAMYLLEQKPDGFRLLGLHDRVRKDEVLLEEAQEKALGEREGAFRLLVAHDFLSGPLAGSG